MAIISTAGCSITAVAYSLAVELIIFVSYVSRPQYMLTISIALQASVAHADTSQHSCPRLMYKAVGVFSITTHAYIPLHWGVSKLEWGHGALKTEDCSVTAVAFVTAMVYVDVCLQLAHRSFRNFRRCKPSLRASNYVI